MSERYIISIDQSTSATKVLLIDSHLDIVARYDIPHRQIVTDNGWVEHDPNEIYSNTIEAVKKVVDISKTNKNSITAVGISNQRETAVVWDLNTTLPVCNAIVWQCTRGESICEQLREKGNANRIREITGLHLSPYFSAAKIAWVLQNIDIKGKKIIAGTIDSWLIYKLTGQLKTDYSNACRTQLFDITSLKWSEEVCAMFGIDIDILAEVVDSNANFGITDFEGFLDEAIPVHAVMGDSHAALYGQGCMEQGMLKATYGTGSSVMMNVGIKPVFSDKGLVSSIGWSIDNEVTYVLEGNINYSGAVISWLINDLNLISSPDSIAEYSTKANEEDTTYIVPAFTGLGAPYWNSNAKAIICGMGRNTKKAEIIRAAQESIAYQIYDIVNIMNEASRIPSVCLRVDGGPTRDDFLMQFQSDILNLSILVSAIEELSALGVASLAGITIGLYERGSVFRNLNYTEFVPKMNEDKRIKKLEGWKAAVAMISN